MSPAISSSVEVLKAFTPTFSFPAASTPPPPPFQEPPAASVSVGAATSASSLFRKLVAEVYDLTDKYNPFHLHPSTRLLELHAAMSTPMAARPTPWT